MKMNFWMISSILLVMFLFTGCSHQKDDEDIKVLSEHEVKDASEFEEINLEKIEGTVSVYSAKPFEWFMIEKDNEKYCFVITDSTKILDNKGKKQTHQMFNVGTNDIVEIKVKTRCGSLSEDYNDVKGWFVCDTLKVLDTLEY